MLDPNEIGAFITKCQNTEYLHHLVSQIKSRLHAIDKASKPVCRNCAGRKTVLKTVNGDSKQVPCPKCQITEPKGPEDFCI